MEDTDGMFINIVTSKPKNKGMAHNEVKQDKKLTKTQIKRKKYSVKNKLRLSTSRQKYQKYDSYRQQPQQKINKNQIKQTDSTKLNKQARDFKIEQKYSDSNIVKQTRQQQNNKKQVKREEYNFNRKYMRQQSKAKSKNKYSGDLGQFKPQNIKNITVQQLMPEVEEQQNYLNKNQIDQFKLQPKLKDSLQKSGVTKFTEIQAKSFESMLNGMDSVIKASTGSGKTLAYLIPLVNRTIKRGVIKKREDGTSIIVICPTRQLCIQAQKQAQRCLKRCPYIVPGCLFGGQETNHEKSRLRKGTNILFCTPGRVLYHLQQTKSFKLDKLQAIVFQQADRTLDMGFQQSVMKILKIIKTKINLKDLHKVLVSAHFNSKVSNLVEQLQMTEPCFIGFQNVQSGMKLENLKQSKDLQINTSSQLKQQYVLMSEQQKIPFMLAYLSVLKKCKTLIFVSTIDQVEYIDYLLNNLKFRDSNGVDTQTKFQNRPIFKIHGDLDQKLRSKTYFEFRQSKEAILISTEVASRGLDFPDLSHIILFDVPPSITDYGNRVGRSARFNQTGVSLLMLHYLESDYAEKIRYYAPNLQLVEKDLVYESFQKILKSINIGDSSLHYIQGLVRASVKNDNQIYQVARKAYVSMLRAYARLPDRHIFAVKKLNLKLLARSFGLNNAQADNNYNPKAKNSHLEAKRKKRKVQNIKRLQVSQYL